VASSLSSDDGVRSQAVLGGDGSNFVPSPQVLIMKVIYLSPGLEYDENMVCEDFLNMGI
jgi:hypothetical protein